MDPVLEMDLYCAASELEDSIATESFGSKIGEYIVKAVNAVIGMLKTIGRAIMNAMQLIRSKLKRVKKDIVKEYEDEEIEHSAEGEQAYQEVEKRLSDAERDIGKIDHVIKVALQWLTAAADTEHRLSDDFLEDFDVERKQMATEAADINGRMKLLTKSAAELTKHNDFSTVMLAKKMGAINDRLNTPYQSCQGAITVMSTIANKINNMPTNDGTPDDNTSDIRWRNRVIQAATSTMNTITAAIVEFNKAFKTLTNAM